MAFGSGNDSLPWRDSGEKKFFLVFTTFCFIAAILVPLLYFMNPCLVEGTCHDCMDEFRDVPNRAKLFRAYCRWVVEKRGDTLELLPEQIGAKLRQTIKHVTEDLEEAWLDADTETTKTECVLTLEEATASVGLTAVHASPSNASAFEFALLDTGGGNGRLEYNEWICWRMYKRINEMFLMEMRYHDPAKLGNQLKDWKAESLAQTNIFLKGDANKDCFLSLKAKSFNSTHSEWERVYYQQRSVGGGTALDEFDEPDLDKNDKLDYGEYLLWQYESGAPKLNFFTFLAAAFLLLLHT